MAFSSSALPVLRSVCRSARRAFSSNSTSSSASGRKTMGTHLLRIEQYPFLAKEVAPAKAVTSTPFNVGGKEWLFHYYINGVNEKTAGSVCAGLELSTRNRVPWDAVAEYQVRIIGRDGKPVWWYSVGIGPRHFNNVTEYQTRLPLLRWLAPCFLDIEQCLTIQCDVTALELDTEPYKR